MTLRAGEGLDQFDPRKKENSTFSDPSSIEKVDQHEKIFPTLYNKLYFGDFHFLTLCAGEGSRPDPKNGASSHPMGGAFFLVTPDML